jgi:hypothetical protein
MRYVLFICGDETLELSPDEQRSMSEAADRWVAEMDQRGARITGNRLADVTDATTIRVRNGELLVTDGPFAETREQIGGFDIIECADMDEALEIARRHPVATIGTIEIRPFWPE